MGRFFKTTPKKGMPISTPGFAEGLAAIERALDRMDIAGGYVDWQDGVPVFVPALPSNQSIALIVGDSGAEGLTKVLEDVSDGDTTASTQAALADAIRVVNIPDDDGGGYRICIDADRVWVGNVQLAKMLAMAKYFEEDGQPRKFDLLSSDGETVISTRFLALDPNDPDASTPSPGDDDYPVPCGHPGNEPGGGPGSEDEDHPADDQGGGLADLPDDHPGDTPSPPSSGDCG